HGPFSNAVNSWINRTTAQIKSAIARELQVAPETITLTDSVSSGCNIPIWGLTWREGDHILLSDCEHPGIIALVEEIRQRFGIKVSTCPLLETLNGGDPTAAIAQNLRPTTRLVVISHILWNTGQVLPLAEIVAACRAATTQYAPVRVLVDAAQSVGVLPLNLSEIGADFYAFTGHKWLCGPAGLGGLYVRPEVLEEIRPTFIGWRGISKDPQGNPTGWLPDGRRFEVATSDFALYGALQAAIALHNEWGTAGDRLHRIQTLSHSLWQRLSALPAIACLRAAPPEAGLVSFQVKDYSPTTHSSIVNQLEKQGFLLRTIAHPDCIRACVHYFTTEDDIDRLIVALSALLNE
ncbi:MAG TPA: aminotransferase class V-fold PLP-dependent enzyme, partial [Chroococcidiopsis sp.]